MKDNSPDYEYPVEPPDYVAALLAVVRRALKHGLEENREALEAAADDVAELYESDDPRQMGWVGSDGRP